jgi:hypothetical protein
MRTVVVPVRIVDEQQVAPSRRGAVVVDCAFLRYMTLLPSGWTWLDNGAFACTEKWLRDNWATRNYLALFNGVQA